MKHRQKSQVASGGKTMRHKGWAGIMVESFFRHIQRTKSDEI